MILERFIDVDGLRTHYLECGEGPPLILVHGGSFGGHYCAAGWTPNMPGLARHFRVFALDKVGCGWTDNPKSDEGYRIGASVAHLRGFIKALGLTGACVAGHSRGGYTVTRLALESPELIRALLVVSSATLMTAPNPIYREWDLQAAKLPDARARCRFLASANSYSDSHVTEAWVEQLAAIEELEKSREAAGLLNRSTGRLWRQFESDLVSRQAETHEWIAREGIRHPTLVLWGMQDPSARFEPVGLNAIRMMMSHAPICEAHVFNHAGHYVFREQQAAFDAVVIDFLKRRVALQ